LTQRLSVKMADAAAIVPIKLNKTVVMKSRERIVRTLATEFSNSAAKFESANLSLPPFENNQ
jgi:hypothetical protein